MPPGIRRGGVGTALLIAAFISGCGAPGVGSPGADSSVIFNSGGITLEYPAGWTRFQYDVNLSFSTLVGYLATVPVHDPCTRTASSMTCGNQSYELAPGTLVVEILAVGGLDELDLELMPLTIGGMPASFRVEPYGRDGRRLVWEVGRSSMSSFRITADLRGPGLDTLQAQVATVVEGLELNPPVKPLPSDPDQLAAAAAAALAVALNALRINSPEGACFSPVPGEARSAVVVISGRPGPRDPIPVTCTSRVEPTRLQMWRVALTIQLDEPTSDLGTVLFIQWVTADGQAGNMEEHQNP
jgi:hypothetical protein